MIERLSGQENNGHDQTGGKLNNCLPEWVGQYVTELDQLDWHLLPLSANNPLSEHVAYYDAQAPKQLAWWQQTQTPVELSIVTVMPNKDVLKLPVGALAYAATALTAIDNLRTDGVNVDTLRIMSPCNINTYCSGGNLTRQLQNAGAYRYLIEGYKNAYYPQLNDVDVTLDTGKTIDDSTITALQEKIDALHHNQPDLLETLVSKLSSRAQRHKKGDIDSPIDEDLLTIAYLLSHPEAWGYGADEILFAKNGEHRINFMPASELSYLLYMTLIKSAWTRTDNKIVTVISNEHITPPYHGRKGEPSLGALLENAKNGKAKKLFPDKTEPQSPETVYALKKVIHDTHMISGKEAALTDLLRETTMQSQTEKPRLIVDFGNT